MYANGGYSARVFVGEQQTPVNLILDTGSSVLVVHNKNYQPELDGNLKASAWVQDIQYGAGGWYGPVVKTCISTGLHGERVQVTDVPIALSTVEKANSFAQADGIWGLAYTGLDHAFDLTTFLEAEKVEPCFSFPYLLDHHSEGVAHYSHFLHQYPQVQITPYFDCIEKGGTVANQFSLLTHRSSIFHPYSNSTPDVIKSHELNQGLLIIGEPQNHANLYQKPLYTVKIEHEKYFNVNVLGIQVGENEIISAPQLATKDVAGYCTNGIVDSGASELVLPEQLFVQVKHQLSSVNKRFQQLLEPFSHYDGKETGVPLSELTLSEWPDIKLMLAGKSGESVTLVIKPETYWQTHAPTADQATFKLCTLPDWPNQLILGLPLLNNYYCIFDRDTNNIIFATKSDMPQHLSNAVAHSIKQNN